MLGYYTNILFIISHELNIKLDDKFHQSLVLVSIIILLHDFYQMNMKRQLSEYNLADFVEIIVRNINLLEIFNYFY